MPIWGCWWYMTDDDADSEGELFWWYATDNLSSSRSACESGETPLSISLARRSSGAGSSVPSGKSPMDALW